MEARVCPGCNLRIEPIYIFDRSPKTKKPYLILRCPRERCGFNIDIEDYTGPRNKHIENQAKTKTRGKTGESRFGVMTYEGKFLCYTLEHESVKIPSGTYRGDIRWSERFQENVPYIHVPSRTGIEIHRGNCRVDSGGCVLVGTTVDDVCLGNSRLALARIMKGLPQSFTVVVE